jgi:hypothetical protein
MNERAKECPKRLLREVRGGVHKQKDRSEHGHAAGVDVTGLRGRAGECND